MKKLMIAAMALATLVTTPALAQNYRERTYAGPMANDPYVGAGTRYGTGYDGTGYYGAGYYGAGSDAYAFAPDGTAGPQPGVYSFGKYRGWDPDPNIRLQLLRDPFDGD